MNHQKAESKLNFFWIFSVVLVTGILSYRFPSATYLAQPFAEHATNYFVAGVIGNSKRDIEASCERKKISNVGSVWTSLNRFVSLTRFIVK